MSEIIGRIETTKILPVLEDLVVTPSKEEQNFKSKSDGYDKVRVKAIDGESLVITPAEQKQTFEGLYDKVVVTGIEGDNLVVHPKNEMQYFSGVYKNVTVNEIEGDTLSITPSTKSQTFEGVYETVNVNPITKETLNVTPKTESQTFNGVYTTVDVEPITGDTLSITPTAKEQTHKGVYTTVNVDPITSEEITITPSTEEQVKEGIYNKVTVEPITGFVPDGDHEATLVELQNLQETYNEQQELIEELNGGYEYGSYKGLKYLLNTEFDKYIDASVGISDTLEVDMKYNLIESSHATMTMVFGARYAALLDAFIFLNRVGDNQFYVQVGDVQKALPFEHESYNIDYRVVMGNNMLKFYNDSGLIFEGDYSDMGVEPFERNDVSMALFAGRGDFGYTLCSAKMKLYYCKIKKNGTLVRDLVPMKRLSDGMCGLFDKVSKTFFKSADNGINDFTGEIEEKYYDESGNEVIVDTSGELYDINYTLETKRLMKETLISKGITVLDTDTFRSYVSKINKL